MKGGAGKRQQPLGVLLMPNVTLPSSYSLPSQLVLQGVFVYPRSAPPVPRSAVYLRHHFPPRSSQRAARFYRQGIGHKLAVAQRTRSTPARAVKHATGVFRAIRGHTRHFRGPFVLEAPGDGPADDRHPDYRVISRYRDCEEPRLRRFVMPVVLVNVGASGLNAHRH